MRIITLEIETHSFLLGCYFTVVSEQEDIIVGLDMLHAHRMKIDLEQFDLLYSWLSNETFISYLYKLYNLQSK